VSQLFVKHRSYFLRFSKSLWGKLLFDQGNPCAASFRVVLSDVITLALYLEGTTIKTVDNAFFFKSFYFQN